VPCGTCRRCARRQEHLCEAVVTLAAPRTSRDGKPVGAMLNAGCFCDYVVLPAGAAIPMSADLPFELAALVGCAVVTGVGAALWTASIGTGDSVAVFGAGGVGLNVIVGARLAGAGRIVAVDPDPTRLELARGRGATEFRAPGEPFDPVDHAFEVVGEPAVMEAALDALAPGGELVLVGATARGATMSFHPRAFLSRQQRITGCIYGSVRPAEHLPQLLAWAAEGTIPLEDLVGRRVALDELEDAFAESANGGVRTVVSFA
jgi:S-(hydroxymethyl)glutathione dehydrogenase/alcohol dehydrogenase